MKSLVEGGTRHYGRFAARPVTVNPLDEFGGLARPLRWLRLKEWVGFTLMHPEVYSSMILQDAHYLGSSEIYAYNPTTGTLHQHAANSRGGSLTLPAALYGGHCAFPPTAGYALSYDFAAEVAGPHQVHIDIAAKGGQPAFRGELTLHGAAPTLSVSSRLPGGGRMYTNKVPFPASGYLRVGDQEFRFDPARDFAILDEHRSMLPYRTRWVWGTFAARTPAGLVGANVATRPHVAGEQEESCLWTPTAAEELAEISFDQASDDPLSPWHIHSADGRLDVEFTPEGRKDVRHQLVLFEIDYFQLYGHYRGVVRGHDRSYDVAPTHGVCESFRARL